MKTQPTLLQLLSTAHPYAEDRERHVVDRRLLQGADHLIGTAALGGSVALLFALIGYFGLVWLRFGYGPALGGANLVWLLGALVGGPVFGIAGRWWRTGGPRQRASGAGLLGAAVAFQREHLRSA